MQSAFSELIGLVKVFLRSFNIVLFFVIFYALSREGKREKPDMFEVMSHFYSIVLR